MKRHNKLLNENQEIPLITLCLLCAKIRLHFGQTLCLECELFMYVVKVLWPL